MVGALSLALTAALDARAATAVQSSAFSFTHGGAVDSGLISVLGTFTTTTYANAPPMAFAKFDTSLGTLTKVDVNVTASSRPFVVTNVGTLNLIAIASSTRTVSFIAQAGFANGTQTATVTNTGGALLTLLSSGSIDVLGAPLAHTASFTAASDLGQFSGSGPVTVNVASTDVLTVSTLVSLFNSAGLTSTGSYAGTATVTYTYTPHTPLTGRIFKDDGSGGGTANDGVANGSEPGAAARFVRLLDGSNNVLDSTQTAADGSYRLMIPGGTANAAALRVQPDATSSWVPTGASAGSSGGSYTRGTETLSLAFNPAASYAGLNFGGVFAAGLSNAENQAALPGTTVLFRHRYESHTVGSVGFAASLPAGTGGGWTQTIYIDANANGRVDAGETPVSGNVAVSNGQVLWLVVQVFVPEAAVFGARVQGTLQATLSHSNAAPVLVSITSAGEGIHVTTDAAGRLVVQTTADKANTPPGGTVTYTVTYTNQGSLPVKTLTIRSGVPAHATFSALGSVSTPVALGAAVTSAPGVGVRGLLSWTFPGQLDPNQSGTVSFSVVVD